MVQQHTSKKQLYQTLADQLQALIQQERYAITIYAQTSALLFHHLEEVNWVGFYLLKAEELLLGPFQGKPACTPIPLGKGVCGRCAQDGKIHRVADVDKFPDHIRCDSASRSEIVLPIKVKQKVTAVLDIDSPIINRFNEEDEHHLQQLTLMLERHIHQCEYLP